MRFGKIYPERGGKVCVKKPPYTPLYQLVLVLVRGPSTNLGFTLVWYCLVIVVFLGNPWRR